MSYNKILDKDIESIKFELLNLIKLTKIQYDKTFLALKNNDRNLFQEIIDKDIQINDQQNDFIKMALWKIAKQHMVAKDLRLAVGGILIAREIERIADYAKIVSRFSLKYNLYEVEVSYISEIFDLVNELLHFVTILIEKFSIQEKEKIYKLEEKINDKFAFLDNKLIEYLGNIKDPKETKKIISIFRQIKNLERAGDHLMSIQEIIYFIFEGQFEDLSILS